MRRFFLLLVLTNLGVAAWLYWHAEAPHTTAITPDNIQGTSRLQLLSELPRISLQQLPHVEPHETQATPAVADSVPGAHPAISQTTNTEMETSPPGKQVAMCVRISSLAREADVDELTHKLAEAEHEVLDSGEEFTERQTYWVMIPPYRTAGAAREAAAKLAQAKVRDFLLIRSGEFKDGISLGLFSQKEGADSRLQEIVALKLGIRPPEIRPRTSSVRNHWLIARVSGDDAMKSLQQQLSAKGIQGTQIECPR